MKKYPALAIIEFDSISAGMFVSDVMVKESPISLFRCGTISKGRYLTLIGGSTAAVETALEEARQANPGFHVDSVFLPDVHPILHDAILGKRTPPNPEEAIAVVETSRVPASIRAAELVLKSTPVQLLELRLADNVLHGKAVSIFQGALHDIEAAVDIAFSYLDAREQEHSKVILTSPHAAMLDQITSSTFFHDDKGGVQLGEI